MTGSNFYFISDFKPRHNNHNRFWTGLFFFQDVAQDPEIQMVLTIELLSINAIYLLVAIRWFFILKLMDLNDMIATKKLQGLTDAEISNDLRYKQILVKYFPQWYKDKQLWSRRAWQGVTKEQIMLRRATNNINVSTTNTTKHEYNRFLPPRVKFINYFQPL